MSSFPDASGRRLEFIKRVLACAALVCAVFTIVVSAQTSRKSFAQQPPFSKYRMISAIARQWIAEENQPEADEATGQNGDEYYLMVCNANYPNLPWRSEKQGAKLMALAFATSMWRADFKEMGILNSGMEAEIARFENQTIRNWEANGWRGHPDIWKQADQFRLKLNRMRAANKNWLEFVLDDGCGAGDIDVKVAISPPSGQLFVISKFYFMLCKAQNIDPMNLAKCDRWNELHGSVSPLAGDYYYLAKWSDGSIRCGQLGVNEAADKEKDLVIAKLEKDACLIK